MISLLHESQFSIFFLILSEKLADFSVISREIADITGIRHNRFSQIRTDVKRDFVNLDTFSLTWSKLNIKLFELAKIKIKMF